MTISGCGGSCAGCAGISSLQATRLPLEQLRFQIDLRGGKRDGDRAGLFR
jgi:hypothetical protein